MRRTRSLIQRRRRILALLERYRQTPRDCEQRRRMLLKLLLQLVGSLLPRKPERRPAAWGAGGLPPGEGLPLPGENGAARNLQRILRREAIAGLGASPRGRRGSRYRVDLLRS